MKPLLCYLILGCLGLLCLAKPPKNITPQPKKLTPEQQKYVSKLKDTVSYRAYLDKVTAQLGFCHQQDTSGILSHSELDSLPAFGGGNTEMLKFLMKNLKYPVLARENKWEGKVIVKFIVDEKGKICNPVILRYLGFGLDEEVLRVIRSMPPWKPALKNNVPVKSFFVMPVTFKLA